MKGEGINVKKSRPKYITARNISHMPVHHIPNSLVCTSARLCSSLCLRPFLHAPSHTTSVADTPRGA